MLSRKPVIIGIDVGNVVSGVVTLLDAQISTVKIMDNKDVFDLVSSYVAKYKNVAIVVEDIKPYAGNLSQQAIDTCKFIGQLTWRLDEISAKYQMVTRSKVRKWVYDSFPNIALPVVQSIIEKRNQKNNDGKNRKPSFVYVNDSIVIKCMKEMWKIETPKPGKGYEYGLKSHSWQALALASIFMADGLSE